MTDKTVVVTGATNGIGEITALELARMGATVIIVGRSEARCQATIDRIQHETGNKKISCQVADLSSLAETQRLGATLNTQLGRLDVLINNAGAYFNTRQVSADGFEMTFALNHLSYFLLTNLLLDKLKATAAESGEARIINVSSDAHQVGDITWDDLQREKAYGGAGFRAYGESKLMNILFTVELAKRLEGTGVVANALHPGFVRTGFGRNNNPLVTLAMSTMQLFALSPEKGAETSIHLASSPQVQGITGAYWAKKQRKQPSVYARNPQSASRLWELSEELVSQSMAPAQ